MGTGRTDEFRKDAVRIALSLKDKKTVRGTVFPEDGLSRRQVADDPGVGLSTLNKWVNDFTAERPNQKWPYGGASTAYRLTGGRYQLHLDA